MICSIYKLIFEPDANGSTPIVLAEWDDELLVEPSFSGAQEVEVVQLLRASHAETFPRGNVSRVVEFTRVYEHATVNAARQFELDHSAVLDVVGKGRLKIEVKGQAARWIENAVLTGAPEKNLDTLNPLQVAFSYTVTGGEIVTT